MWEAIKYVSSGLTLVAFIVAVVAWVYTRIYKIRSRTTESLLRAAKEEDRAELIAKTTEFIDASTLKDPAKLKVLLTQIHSQEARFRTTAVVVLFIAILLAGVAVYAISRSDKPTQPPKVVLIDSHPRRYDPESQVTNAHEIERLIHEISQADRRPISTEHILVGRNFENDDQILGRNPDLIVIHLSCFFLSTNDQIDLAAFRSAMDEFERFVSYILKHSNRSRFLVYSREPPKTNHWPQAVLQEVTSKYLQKKMFVEAHASRMRLLVLPWDARFTRPDIVTTTKSALRDEFGKL